MLWKSVMCTCPSLWIKTFILMLLKKALVLCRVLKALKLGVSWNLFCHFAKKTGTPHLLRFPRLCQRQCETILECYVTLYKLISKQMLCVIRLWVQDELSAFSIGREKGENSKWKYFNNYFFFFTLFWVFGYRVQSALATRACLVVYALCIQRQ